MESQFQSIYSQKNVVSMLLFIEYHGRVKESRLTEIVSNYYSSIQVATILLDNGLVKKAIDDRGHTTTWWEITDKGRAAAELLREAEDPKGEVNKMDCGSPSEEGNTVKE